jgi:tetratricopeptide (TPR) repeat protein
MINGKSMALLLTALIVLVPTVGTSRTFDEYLANAQSEMDVWNFEEAIGFYDQALALDQTRPRAFFMRGTAKRETGDHDGALLDFDQALAISPDEPEYLYERGMLRHYVQDYQGAVADFDAFLKIEPTMETILQLRGEAKYQLNDYAGAAADYTAALDQNPQNPELHYLRAYAWADLEKWDNAVADFTAVMEMEPQPNQMFNKMDVALLRRADVKRRAGDHAAALEDCDLALSRNAEDLEAIFTRGVIRVAMADYKNAVDDLNTVIERYPLPEAYHQRGLAKQGLGDVDGAEADLVKALELGYEDPGS